MALAGHVGNDSLNDIVIVERFALFSFRQEQGDTSQKLAFGIGYGRVRRKSIYVCVGFTGPEEVRTALNLQLYGSSGNGNPRKTLGNSFHLNRITTTIGIEVRIESDVEGRSLVFFHTERAICFPVGRNAEVACQSCTRQHKFSRSRTVIIGRNRFFALYFVVCVAKRQFNRFPFGRFCLVVLVPGGIGYHRNLDRLPGTIQTAIGKQLHV